MKQKRMSGCSKGGHTSKSQEMTNSPKRNEMIKESESSISTDGTEPENPTLPLRMDHTVEPNSKICKERKC